MTNPALAAVIAGFFLYFLIALWALGGARA